MDDPVMLVASKTDFDTARSMCRIGDRILLGPYGLRIVENIVNDTITFRMPSRWERARFIAGSVRKDVGRWFRRTITSAAPTCTLWEPDYCRDQLIFKLNRRLTLSPIFGLEFRRDK